MMSRAPDRDAERLTREFAGLSRVITERCGAVFEAARRGGPERHALDARGDVLQALQAELAQHIPAATSGDISALHRVIDIQHRMLVLLDTLQAWPAHTPFSQEPILQAPLFQMPPQTPDPVLDIVTMRPLSGPAGETLWVADAAPGRATSTAAPAHQAPHARNQRAPETGPAQKLPPRPAEAKKPAKPEVAPSKPAPRKPASDARSAGDTEAKPRLASLPRHANIALQLAAAGTVIASLVLITASLIGPIAGRLGSGTADFEQERKKPAERLPQSVATAAATIPAPAVAQAASIPTAAVKPGFVAVVSTHDTFAAARQAFVTLKSLYPVPLSRTAPDIQGVKPLLGSERFQLGLLPALTKADAEDLCRRLTGLGHPTCQVKPQS